MTLERPCTITDLILHQSFSLHRVFKTTDAFPASLRVSGKADAKKKKTRRLQGGLEEIGGYIVQLCRPSGQESRRSSVPSAYTSREKSESRVEEGIIVDCVDIDRNTRPYLKQTRSVSFEMHTCLCTYSVEVSAVKQGYLDRSNRRKRCKGFSSSHSTQPNYSLGRSKSLSLKSLL